MGMSKGLLGAIGGLGDALQTVGKDLGTRRERALEQARLLAAEQSKREQQLADKAEDRTFQLGRDAATASAAMARTTAQIEANRTLRAEDRTFKIEDREDDQSFRESQRVADAQAARDLAILRGEISRNNDSASESERRTTERFKQRISGSDVKGIVYQGAKNVGGELYAEAVIYTKSGQMKPTGRWVHRGKATDDTLPDDPKQGL